MTADHETEAEADPMRDFVRGMFGVTRPEREETDDAMRIFVHELLDRADD